jgi:hypothetical protein
MPLGANKRAAILKEAKETADVFRDKHRQVYLKTTSKLAN